jgi:predicted RNase H-like HicB family nuclease
MSLKFEIFRDGDCYVASWNAPLDDGGITTQGKTIPELIAAISEAVHCHFDDDEMPEKAELHFATNPEVSLLEAS